ncbi:MAG TPA: hypothetical protein VKA00_08760 [Trueperaceae bacterium]|nr:hypothetical protein [Trueperaceae bacterium]
MNRARALGLATFAVLLLALSACSGPVFDPTGNYAGTLSSGGSPVPVTTAITATSTPNTWDFSLSGGGTAFTGTCTHDTSVSAENLTCTLDVSGTILTFTGDLHNDTWSGTVTDGMTPATFTVTRS